MKKKKDKLNDLNNLLEITKIKVIFQQHPGLYACTSFIDMSGRANCDITL